MTDAGDNHEPPDGMPADERLALAHAILDAWRRQLYPLPADERKAISQFIALTTQRRPVDPALLQAMNRLTRHHRQMLIALAPR